MKPLKFSLIILLSGLFVNSYSQLIQVASTSAIVGNHAYADLINLPPPSVYDNAACNAYVPGFSAYDYGLYCKADAKVEYQWTYAHGWGDTYSTIDGDLTQRLKIKWRHTSHATSGIDPGQYFVWSTDSFVFTVDMMVLPGGGFNIGDPITVYYRYNVFTSGQTQHENVSEDSIASTNAFGIDGINQLGPAFNFYSPGGLPGYNRLDNVFGQISTNVGQLFSVDGFSILHTQVQNPIDQDAAHARFEGQIELAVYPLPESQLLTEMEFSVDIGSDSEMSDPFSDGDEVFDPGDVYILGSPLIPYPGQQGIIDDQQFLLTDPWPVAGDTNSALPVNSGAPIQQLSDLYFDMDGLDQTDFSLSSMSSIYGPYLASMTPVNSDYVHDACYMIISYDDDGANNYCDQNGNVPVNSVSPYQSQTYGKTNNRDELVAFDLSPFLPSSVLGTNNFTEEQYVHPNFLPNPDSNENQDDDTDALDWNEFYVDPSVTNGYSYNGPGFLYFSPDHEATYINPLTNTPLNPGSVYEFAMNSIVFGIVEVVNANTHLGLVGNVDIDAFEFGYIWDDQANRMGFAMIFSVDDNDLLTTGDESGGLSPKKLYASFLNGNYFEYLSQPLDDDIDAITLCLNSYVIIPPGLSADFSATPLTATIGDSIHFTDQSLGNPSSWLWDFGNGLTSTAQNPTHIYNFPGTYTITLTVSDGINSSTETKTAYITITSPSLSVDAGPDVTICAGASTILTATAQGGSGIYAFMWAPVSYLSIPTINNPIASPPVTTTYTIYVTDAAGNVAYDNVTVTVTSGLQVSFVITHVSCFGGSDGKIETTVSGGLPPYSFLWSNGLTSKDIDNLTAGTYTMTVLDASGCVIIIDCDVAEPPFTTSSPNWNYIQTGNNHTILIPSIASLEIDGSSIANGSYLGVFYDSSGTLACAGYIQWNGSTTALAAWADDTQTTDKDGFLANESFNWKIWDATSGNEYDANATYDLTMPNQGEFAVNGLSALLSLEATTTDTQVVILKKDWSYVSSYIEAIDDSIPNIFAPVVNDLIIVKDCNGNVYWPQFNLDMLGSWVITEFYQVYMAQASQISIIGTKVDPQTTPISLSTGWNCVAYLHDTSAPIEDMLLSIENDILLVKNGDGDIYMPNLPWGGSLNLIGDMNPGEGYFMNMTNAATLIYPTITTKGGGYISNPAECSHFSNAPNTGINMSLIIHAGIIPCETTHGDEVAVFNSNGLLAGSGIVSNQILSIPVWGNNELSTEPKGMMEEEPLLIRYWRKFENKEYTLEIEDWLSGSGFYNDNEISIAAKVQVVDQSKKIELNQNIPNPAHNLTSIKIYLPDDSDIELILFDLLGNKLETLAQGKFLQGEHTINFDVEKYAKGSYFYKLTSDNQSLTRAMIIGN